MRVPLTLETGTKAGTVNQAIPEVAALNRVQDQAVWDTIGDPAAKIEALRQAVVALIHRSDQHNDSLLSLLKTFDTDDGRQVVLRHDLVVANGADIVIQN